MSCMMAPRVFGNVYVYVDLFRKYSCPQMISSYKIYKPIIRKSFLLQARTGSTAAQSINNDTKILYGKKESSSSSSGPPNRDPLDLTFSNTKDAYKSKTTGELVRALVVLKLSSYDFLVFNHTKVSSNDNRLFVLKQRLNCSIIWMLRLQYYYSINIVMTLYWQLIRLGRKLLGARFFRFLMKQSFYGQFVAGENEVAIRPTLDHLRSFGVKSILDYSAEEDISEEQVIKTEMS